MQNEPGKRRILCLWLPNWLIQRLVVAQPELRCRRVVLFRQDSRRGQLVAAASPLAERDGVQINMPLAESKSLLSRKFKGVRPLLCEAPGGPFRQKGPDPFKFHILPHDPTADLVEIQKLADELDGFSPIVGLQQETDQPDCIFLDVTGLASLFGSEFKLATGVEQFCRERGYLPRIAIANTIGLAQGMAQYQPDLKPSTNISIVPADDLHAHHSLPVAALRLRDWTNETLHQLGVRHIGQLLQLPRRDLSARFGDEIHNRIDQLTGEIVEPVIARQQPPEFYAEQLLDYPTGHKQTIEVIMQRLIAKICAELSAAQQGALQWTIRLYCQRKLPMKLYVSLFQPTATADHVVQLANMQLDQMLQPPDPRRNRHKHSKRKDSSKTDSKIKLNGQPLEINEITVAVTSCVLLTHRQRKLFDENPRLDRQSLAHLINRLSGRLGRQHVVYPTIVSGAQPEHAFQCRPLVNPHRRQPRRTATKTGVAGSHVMARPLRMFQPSIELETVSLSDTHNQSDSTAPPALLVFAGNRYTIVNQCGPERIETGWWRGRMARRDYWRVETDTHQQFWIYRDLRKQAWFLHGEF